MKVRVNLVVEVNPKKWANANGRLLDADGNYDLAEVREDIRNFYLYVAQDSSMTEETDAEVNLGKGA